MAGINSIYETLQDRGYEVVGICPDLPLGLQEVHSGKKLKYPLLSDSSMELATALGIAFHVDDETVAMYLEKFKIDLEKASGQTHHNLPVPAVIIVDAEGKLQYVYTNPDYTTRLKNDELLEVAK